MIYRYVLFYYTYLICYTNDKAAVAGLREVEGPTPTHWLDGNNKLDRF